MESSYFLENNVVSFSIGDYDHKLPLIIDPTLEYGTYLGGADGADSGTSLRLDGAGNVYVTGYTASTNFPASVGAYDTSANSANDVYVAKFNPAGTTLLWATYLGGSGLDNGKEIAIDGTGAVYVGVYTASSNFPTTAGAYDSFEPRRWCQADRRGPVDSPS